jgi:hypothetical protein
MIAPERTSPRATAISGALALALLTAGCTDSGIYPRVYMVEEDSHPHEVRPGTEARFHVPAVGERRKLDVRCTLVGPAGPVRLVFHGIEPSAWARANPRFTVGNKEIGVDIEGVVEPDRPTPYFAFANDDPARLLWHQCYNN